MREVALGDRFTAPSGRVLLTGMQAVVRLLINQSERDRAVGLGTGGYVSGYRGSPLGALDTAIERAEKYLKPRRIVFRPGVNEDLAATAVWGSQQTHCIGEPDVDGVFGLWYGKGPGVDRSGDVLKHANFAGTWKNGGVIALAGDDHTCKSSTIPHHSELAFIDAAIPLLVPSTVQELLDFSAVAWAMSRFSGCWVGLKVVSDIADATAVVDCDPFRVKIQAPDFALPEDGVHIRIPNQAVSIQGRDQEARLYRWKLPAAKSFAAVNRIDTVLWHGAPAEIGIITVGKAYLDVRRAFGLLGLDEATVATLGIGVYKVGLVWPLEQEGLHAFVAQGYRELLVVEEKRAVIEPQVKEIYYCRPDAPRVFGKHGPDGKLQFPPEGELSPLLIARILANQLEDRLPEGTHARLRELEETIKIANPVEMTANRAPYFCSGCPHNTSTNVPAGSTALGGVGCHILALGMGRENVGFTHMGAEGVNWTGLAPFTKTKHVFQNIGDGTYFHSGYLAIRAAIAAKHNITYKILYNDAVAMTGGQPVDGTLTAPMIVQQMRAEGVRRIEIVAEDSGAWAHVPLPSDVSVHPRTELMAVQHEMRKIEGVSILIYDQTCATEKRRRRKRGKMADPDLRIFINELVCEGCGDCSRASNCLSVQPSETEFGRKRQIDQSSCNKDISCVKGFCPSFITIEGVRLRKVKKNERDLPQIPAPVISELTAPYDILITGIGGTGVVTISAILAMSAHLTNLGATVMDMTGMAQKGGAVLSHVRLAPRPEDIDAVRIAEGSANLLIACDNVTASSTDALIRTRRKVTRAVVNDHEAITAAFIRNPDAPRHAASLRSLLEARFGAAADFLDATGLATTLLGDAIAANMMLLGFAWQKGLVPLPLGALMRAIELNDTAVALNKRAFDIGRLAAHDPTALRSRTDSHWQDVPAHHSLSETLDEIVQRRIAFLTEYHNATYARRFGALLERIREKECAVRGSEGALSEAAARNLFKLMAYKDEYEVARLYSAPSFLAQLSTTFEKMGRIKIHLAPPMFAPRDPETGHLRKRAFGPWVLTAFRALKHFKFLRGTPFDPFGYTRERRAERALSERYEAMLDRFVDDLTPERISVALDLARLPESIRGFGHVKEAALAQVLPRWSELMKAYEEAKPMSIAA